MTEEQRTIAESLYSRFWLFSDERGHMAGYLRLVLDELAASEKECSRLHDALVEIDTYLAHDPLIWRLGSAMKAGDVLCDVLGSDTIAAINAEVKHPYDWFALRETT